MKQYNKPELKFTEAMADQPVADTCWGLKAGSGKGGKPGSANYNGPFYYDVAGAGYVSFYLTSTDGSCGAPDAYNLTFYTPNGNGTYSESDGSAYESQVETALTQKGGNNGQPYSRLTVDFPTSGSGMS